MSKKVFKLILALVLCVSLLAACGGGAATPTNGTASTANSTTSAATNNASLPSKIVNIAISENIIELDPHNVTNLPSIAAMHMMFDMLVDSDHKGNYTPMLATDWTTSEDGLTWTFNLRKGVKFSNGEDFTSADVVTTFQRLIDHPELACSNTYWKVLKGVEAIDDYSVKIILKEPFGCTLLSLANTWIIPNEAYAKEGDKLWTEQKCYGTGPWKLEKWVDGQYTHYLKNTDYWGDFESYYDEVYFRHILEPSTAIAGHLSGDVNAYIAAGGISTDMLPLYKGSESKIDLVKLDSGAFQYMGFNCKAGTTFADINARMAFEYALDRQSILDNVIGGGKVTNGLMNDTTIGYDETQAPYVYDPAKAKEYLSKSSYKGEPIMLSSNTSTLKSEEVLLAVSEMLNAVGFKTSIEVVENATLANMRATGDYDVFLVTNMHPGGDPYGHLNLRILNDGHHSSFVDEKMFDLIKKSNAESDQAIRAGYFKEINKLIRADAGPHTILYQLQTTEAIDKGVTGILLYTDGYFNYRWVTNDAAKK